MADILPRHYIFGTIILMFFIVSGVTLLGEFKKYNPSYDTTGRTAEFNQTFNKMDELNDKVSSFESNVKNSENDFGLFGVLNSLINSAWSALSTIFDSFDFMNKVLNGLTTFFGIPSWVIATISSFITIILAFGIYSLLFQKDG